MASDELAKNKKEILSDTGSLGLYSYKSSEIENRFAFLIFSVDLTREMSFTQKER